MRRIETTAPDPESDPGDGWQPAACWLAFPEGVARAFVRADGGAVRVDGPATAPAELPLPLWTDVGGRTWPLEASLRHGVTGTVGDEELVVRMSERGLVRSARQLELAVGDRSYTFGACGPPMSGRAHLVRTRDGAERYRVTFLRDRHLLAADADPVEQALVTILVATNSRERVTHNPLRRA